MLGVFDLRKKALYAMSDHFEEDLTAVCIQKEGKKVVASTSEGVMNVFSWDWFGDCNDRIVGHPGCIDTMISYDDDIVITGCEDGLIRAVSVLPNKIIAILGDPLDPSEEVFHIQRVSLSHDKKLLASCTLDDMVKMIDVSTLEQRIKDPNFNVEEYEASISQNLRANHGKTDAPHRVAKDGEDWESGSGDDEDEDMSDGDSDSDSDSDEGGRKKQKKKDTALNPKNATLQGAKKMMEDKNRKDFFDDL
jgi:WD40 repeat protein